MSWSVKVFYAGTAMLATDVPFYFTGNLGADDDTEWTGTESGVVSTDGAENEDPIIGHRLLTPGNWSFENGYDEVEVYASGTVEYLVAVMDYCGGDVTEAALSILLDSEEQFGSDIESLSTCPTWSFEIPDLTVGVPYDETFTAPADAPWDWTNGGYIDAWNLPDGLEEEIIDSEEPGVAPSLRIYGTPQTDGSFEIGVYLSDDFDNDTEFEVAITVLPAPDPEWSIDAPEFRVGEPYDATFTAPSVEPWDWSDGGSIWVENLPEGLQYEVVDEWESDTAPRVRIFGTPLTAGDYTFTVELEDDFGSWVEFDVTGTVAPNAFDATRSLELTLQLQIGDKVAGAPADVTASGLDPDADYDLVVRSTPQTVGVGTVPSNGVVTRTVTLPDLEAGWHSLTFTSTWAGGGAAVAKVWLEVGADGTLLAISRTDPALANTGQDTTGTLVLGGMLFAAGLGLVAVRRRRSFVN